MALGIPVIATNCSLGIKDLLLNNKIGLLVKNNDVNELKKAIMYSLEEDNNKKLSKKSKKIKKVLNKEDILNKWEQILK